MLKVILWMTAEFSTEPVAYDKEDVCGRYLDTQEETKIVGGKNEIPAHSNPWMVRLSSEKGGYWCGGTLISKSHVL